MKSSELIQRALQNEMNSDARIAALEKRVQALESALGKTKAPPKEEIAFEKMTESELRAWAEKAAAAITHITMYDLCSKCNRTIAYDRPCGVWKHTVTCPHCKYEEEKTLF